jgi:hypothetical protein
MAVFTMYDWPHMAKPWPPRAILNRRGHIDPWQIASWLPPRRPAHPDQPNQPDPQGK